MAAYPDGHLVIVLTGVNIERDFNLMDVAQTLRPPGLLLGLGQRRQQERRAKMAMMAMTTSSSIRVKAFPSAQSCRRGHGALRLVVEK